MFRGVNATAVVIGFFASVAIGFSGLILLEAAAAMHAGGMGYWSHDKYEVNTAFIIITESAPYRLIAIGIFGFDSVVGGGITGWLARTCRIKNAVILAGTKIVVFAPFTSSPESYPIWMTALSLGMSGILTVLGGWLSDRFLSRKREKGDRHEWR